MSIISRPVPIQESSSSRVTFLHRLEKDILSAQEIADVFNENGFQIDHCTLEQRPIPGQDIVALLEIESPMFEKLSAIDLQAFQLFLSRLEGQALLWVTRPTQMHCEDPAFGLIQGLARTVRIERSLHFATLEIDCIDSAPPSILKVFQKIRAGGDRIVDQDWEFALSRGMIHVGRYQPVHLKRALANISSRSRAVELEIGTRGLLQTLKWKTFEEPTTLREDEVLVECKCAGLNFRVSFATPW
jgi:hypothetical protein